MMQWIKPTRIKLNIFLVLFVGFFGPTLINSLWMFYVTVNSTPEQLTAMAHSRPSPIMYFFVDPILSLLWLYILGCIILLIMNKRNNKKVSRKAV